MAELTSQEKSFIKEWEYQTSGSKAGFFILYTVIWSALLFAFSVLVTYFFRAVRIWFLEYAATFIQVFLAGLLITLVMYYRNQSRYFQLKLKQSIQVTESGSAPQV